MAHAGASLHRLAFAGRYADILIREVFTTEEARHQRSAVRHAAESSSSRCAISARSSACRWGQATSTPHCALISWPSRAPTG
ncbi:hypothetical protein [Arthrobacter ramosus]|uniref:hypothetical protein n=1 Tax=Arthrobacter ramosus TaxID=1672 RepID=UPI001F192040|nr:hypothetical protein [Arthrobacter ramosus]